MADSDQIREHCLSLVHRARANGEHAVVIRAGDIHTELGLNNRMPQVVAVLGSDRFEKAAVVKRIAVDGPINGANTLFVYRIK